jgi:hypothetical protein
LDSSFWTEEAVWDRTCITVEVYEEPHTVMIETEAVDQIKRQTSTRAGKEGGVQEAAVWERVKAPRFT